MINTKLLLGSALAAMASIAASATIAQAGPRDATRIFLREVLRGLEGRQLMIARRSTHSCAGTSTADNQGDAWIYLPAGACAKLTTGSLEPKA